MVINEYKRTRRRKSFKQWLQKFKKLFQFLPIKYGRSNLKNVYLS